MPRMVVPALPPEQPRVYVSVESRAGQLTIDGPLTLLRDLLIAVQPRSGVEQPGRELRDHAITPIA